jgi:hypothetical protein
MKCFTGAMPVPVSIRFDRLHVNLAGSSSPFPAWTFWLFLAIYS